ncbi:uncharacterized protein LOC110836932, partial [Zootermopsis nevadensis]|uniref:uncharacterized protein LOC110836932 n=1 Tax=Zootermopsis nevadensis TaxID=136037 RepID=UPI000B8EBC3D
MNINVRDRKKGNASKVKLVIGNPQNKRTAILLGVVGKLALVLGECDLGTPKLKNVDWNELTDTWYWVYQTSNKAKDNFDCVRSNVIMLPSSRMFISTLAYDKSKQREVTINGESSNFTTNGYFDILSEESFWTGSCLLLAIERDSFFVLTFCSKQGGNRIDSIGFRNRSPYEATLEKAFEAFNETGLDASQLVKW